MISSLASSKYTIENGTQITATQSSQTRSFVSLIPSHSTILLDPSANYEETKPSINSAVYNTKHNRFPEKSIQTVIDDKSGDEKSFLSTKILYKPYSMTNGNVQNKQQKIIVSQQNKEPTVKTKSINSTIFKKVTPSITDRVIADLKKEEYLASQQKNHNDDIASTSTGNDDAIYIDADNDEVNTEYSIPTTIESFSDDENINSKQIDKPKISSNNFDIGIRDKKSPKKPTLFRQEQQQQQYENQGFVDIPDSRLVNMFFCSKNFLKLNQIAILLYYY